MVASIAVSAAIYAIDKPYSYRIPPHMCLQVGMRVIVPFGRGNRRSEGIVIDINNDVVEGLKPVERILDAEPIVSEAFMHLAAFIRDRYFCTFYDAIKAILPVGLWFDTAESYSLTDLSADENSLSAVEKNILSCLRECAGSMKHSSLKLCVDEASQLDKGLQSLLHKKLIKSDVNYKKRIQDKTDTLVSLAVPAEQAMEYAQLKQRSAPLQYELLRLLTAVGSGNSKELCYLTGANNQTIRRLQDLGYVSVSQQEAFRSSLPSFVEPAEPIVLNDEQSKAFQRLREQAAREKPGIGLLYGITGSGKTSVYLQLIKDMLAQGKGSIVLVPEIALTPQLVHVFMSHFGQTVSVLHSALRVTERYDSWKKIRSGDSRVVIGTRSAIFAPVKDLGLIVVDEEQEHTYKSENTPRYHAREVAMYRGAQEHALVLLGSATPSVESMYFAKNGIYSLNCLKSRYNGKHLPAVEIVDMKKEILQGNSSDISASLVKALRSNIDSGHQSILFLNRRGAATSMICVECGDVQQCPRCSVSLTYHRANNRLMCHHCGYSHIMSERCDVCGGRRKTIGSGTQKVETQLQQLFPNVETLRMDADTISASNNHEVLLNRFRDEKIPVLIGTQMVTKGLDFENVTLVGIIDADMSLYVNHYRAAETTFSMLTQVIGRSGRGIYPGKAIIQTMTPEHSVICMAAKQDYDGFYDLEVTLRQLQHCPPCGDLFTITFFSLRDEFSHGAAFDFKMMLQQVANQYQLQILGPSPAAVLKVNHTYRYKLTISCTNSKHLRLLLSGALKTFIKNKKYRGVTAYIDVNSYD